MRHADQVRLVKEMLARIDAGTNVDAGGLRRNPTAVYRDPDLAECEWETFFAGHPQLIGLSGDLAEPGSFMTVDDLGIPILATRDADGSFRAMVNACRHRGAVVETDERGISRRFTCPFHHWTYDTAGTLVGLPRPDHFGEVDTGCLGLVSLPALEWHGLLLVHPDPAGTIDVDSLFDDELRAELEHWDFGGLRYLDRDDYDIACNWKLAIDTFGETYHFGALHKNTINLGFHGNVQCYDTFGRNHRMLLCRREIDSMRERPEEEWDITVATLPVYYLFPNIQLMPFRDGCYLVRVYPRPGEPGRHVSRITFYVRPGVEEASDLRLSRERAAERGEQEMMQRTIAQMFANVIRDEDYVMSASQQRTANASALEHVVYGRNEPALHHYHNTYRTALGLEPLPLLDETEVTA